MYGICLTLCWLLPNPAYQLEVEAAKADFQQYGYSARYLYLGTAPIESRENLFKALCFKLPHLTRNPVIDHHIPVRIYRKDKDTGESIPTDMYRIDLDLLGWGQKAWIELACEYPYSDFVDPLIIRGDWLLRITADASDSQSYYNLLYAGVGVPKNKAEFLKVWDIVISDKNRTAVIIDEDLSGVSLHTRLTVEGGSHAGNWFETFDSATGFGNADPLEMIHKLKELNFDAQELIVPKLMFETKKGDRGICLIYWLNDKQGNKLDEAATNIVVDDTRFLREPSVRVPGGCMACHAAFNGAPENTYREWIRLGIERYEKDSATVAIRDSFLLSDPRKLINRLNEDFETFTQAACKLNAVSAQKNWRVMVEAYDDQVSLEQAAREVYAKDADELRHAIAFYSDGLGPTEFLSRLLSLTEGRTVPRKTWEGIKVKGEAGVFHLALKALADWRAKK